MRADRPPREPTTKQHVPPNADKAEQGAPAFLVAFPAPCWVPPPESGATVGRIWLAAAGRTDSEVSSRHLRYTRSGGRNFIEDAGSRNGTWIHGRRLPPGERVPLEDGAVVRVGLTVLVFWEAFTGPRQPAPPLGKLVGPFGLWTVQASIAALHERPSRNVLIEGETGTGKELVAEAVLAALGRAGRPFASINVAGVPAGVFESQLFGWIRGAYSGSGEGSAGVLRAHEGGAVFLDEIGELPLDLQPKMLRLLENREILPVGANRPVRVDVAILAATNRSLEEMVEKGAFRRDLLARFLARIELPPLRDRPEDLFAIVEALCARRGTPLDPRAAEVEAVERLMLHEWLANVREVERVIASLGAVSPLTLSAVNRALGPLSATTRAPLTREAIERMLAECGDNQSEAARRLGIDRGRLIRALRRRGDA
jgi:sigma-54 dependent transcriptional regulator, acetoin dehydrogenase operon transcriptional activator AcoR